jgi:hypothetical protein
MIKKIAVVFRLKSGLDLRYRLRVAKVLVRPLSLFNA